MVRKYPGTPYWPWSPSVGRGDHIHADPQVFVGREIVLTEKIDGGNTLLHKGKVYARSVSGPSEAPWMAMVRKHHAWKVLEPDVLLYGEDIYAVHSIAYAPVPEAETFHAFALRDLQGHFASFDALERYVEEKGIPLVPILYRGTFSSVVDLADWITEAHAEPSALGGDREGVVIRLANAFPEDEFACSVCKSVRVGHVQTDRHWTRSWRPCRIDRTGGKGRRGTRPVDEPRTDCSGTRYGGE